MTNISFQQPARSHQRAFSPGKISHRFIVPIADLDDATVQSLAYARSITPHVVAVHVALDEKDAETIHAHWDTFQARLPIEERVQLVSIDSPYRSLLRPLLTYIDIMQDMHPDETLTVILPELVVAHWWEQPLHNQTALRLKAALPARPGIVVTNIPQHTSIHISTS